jgi:hypothetical protein
MLLELAMDVVWSLKGSREVFNCSELFRPEMSFEECYKN